MYSIAPANLTVQVRVDFGVVAMKEFSTLPRAPKMELHHQMQLSVIWCRTHLFVGRSFSFVVDTVSVF